MDKIDALISTISAPTNQIRHVAMPIQFDSEVSSSERQVEVVSHSRIYYCETCKINFRIQRELDEHRNLNECLQEEP